MLKCVLFDWSGTLADDVGLFDEIDKKTFVFWREVGFNKSFEEFKKLSYETINENQNAMKYNAKFDRTLWPKLFAKNAGLKISDDEATKEFELFMESYVKFSKIFPETKGVLEFIKNKRLPMALVSNNWKDAYEVFEKCGVKNYFDAIVVSEDLNCLKFNLEPFKFVIKKLNVKPDECLMVGNSISEDGACMRLGIKFCLVDTEGKHNGESGRFDFKIKNLNELKNIITELVS